MEKMADTPTFTPGYQKTSPNISSFPSDQDQDCWIDQLESNRSFEEIFMDIDKEEEEELPVSSGLSHQPLSSR